jgi:hypothetical protein
LGDVKPIDAPPKGPEADNLKNDSRVSPAVAVVFSVNKSIGLEIVPPGLTCTCAGSICVATACPASIVKLVN